MGKSNGHILCDVDMQMGNVCEQMRRQTLRSQEAGDDISVCGPLCSHRQKQLSKQGLTGLKSMGK